MNDTKTGTFSSTLRRWSALAAAAAIVLGLARAARTRCPAGNSTASPKTGARRSGRASVIPVYPLTEDLHPGDVFLVQRSISEQHKESGKDGASSRWTITAFGSRTLPPRARLWAPSPGSSRCTSTRTGRTSSGLDSTRARRTSCAGPIKPDTENGESPSDVAANRRAEAEAPRAAFPSYSFKVRTGTGLGVALPVKGVPVGLSYMQSADADGTVTLADAYTYAADSTALYDAVRDWAKNTGRWRRPGRGPATSWVRRPHRPNNIVFG